MQPRQSTAFFAFVSFLLAVPAGAQSIDYADDPGSVVLRYTVRHGEIAGSLPGPSLVLHGDGTVRVHRPAYMKARGDRTLRLSRGEIAALLNDFEAAGVLDLDPRALRAEMRQAALDEQVALTRPDGIRVVGPVNEISDASVTIIEINVLRGRGTAARPVQKTIRWTGLQRDARRFKNLRPIQGLAEAEQHLTAIMERAK